MGQQEVLEFLDKNRRWFTIRELVDHLHINQSAVGISVNKLVSQGLILSYFSRNPVTKRTVRLVKAKPKEPTSLRVIPFLRYTARQNRYSRN